MGTPIGNLSDLGARAADILRSVDVVAAEDTRVTQVLLRHIGSAARTISAHEHNQRRAAESVLGHLRAGRSVALVSDAGTPLVSDPGALLLRADRVPTSIALAQAAIESGWGTSLLSRRRNNVYGQQGWAAGFREMFGMAAAQPRSGMAEYPTVAACVGSYIHNLNTHRAYADFRLRRKQMRERAQPLDPVDLAFGLEEYSTRGWAYINEVLGIMEYNRLERFDIAPAAPVSPPSG